MKKIFFMMAMAAMVAVSCQKDGDNGSNGNNGGEGTNPPANEVRVLCDFEETTLSWTGASGCSFEAVENPAKTGINTSENVGCVTAGGAQWEFCWSTAFGGGDYNSPETIDFLNFTEEGWIIKVDVYSPKANSPVYLKLESGQKGNPSTYEITNVTTTKVNEWETLEFDYETAALADGTYGNLVILFDAGVEGDADKKFYFDNVRICAE